MAFSLNTVDGKSLLELGAARFVEDGGDDDVRKVLSVSPEDIRLSGDRAGVTISRFTWSWVALTMSEGLLTQAGLAVLSAIIDLLMKKELPDLDAMMQNLLKQFEAILKRELDQQELARLTAILEGFTSRAHLYVHGRDLDRLNRLIDETEIAAPQLKKLMVAGYKPFMVLSTMRLNLLQELVKRTPVRPNDPAPHFEFVRHDVVRHHEAMKELVMASTHPVNVLGGPAVIAAQAMGKWNAFYGQVEGLEPNDIVRFTQVNNIPVLYDTLNGVMFVSQRKIERGERDCELTDAQANYVFENLNWRPSNTIARLANVASTYVDAVKEGDEIVARLKVAVARP